MEHAEQEDAQAADDLQDDDQQPVPGIDGRVEDDGGALRPGGRRRVVGDADRLAFVRTAFDTV
jgi:hypothetical protein